jgi:hypothetical protein
MCARNAGIRGRCCLAPEKLHELLARDDGWGRAHQEFENPQAGWCQRALQAAAPYRQRVDVKLQVAHTEDPGAPSTSPRDGSQSRSQLLQRKRLAQIVVRAGLEPGKNVSFEVSGGEHQDWRAATSLPPQPAADIQATRAGKPYV